MDDEESEEERERWNEERNRVLDEWSEIELKGSAPMKSEPGSAPAGRIAPESSLDILYPLLIGPQSPETARLVPPPIPTTSAIDRLLQVCLCRPAKSHLHTMVYTHKSMLLRLADVPYNNQNGTHWLMLSDYFRAIAQLALDTPDTPCQRVGAHWQIVGFQGTDPATDFRGCGILALLQLHSFTQKLPHNILKTIVDLSRTEPNDFPLAVVSINITGLILAKLKQGRLDAIGDPVNGLYPAFATLHATCLAHFCARYKSDNLSLAECQSLLNEIDGRLEKSLQSLLNLLKDPQNDELMKQLM